MKNRPYPLYEVSPLRDLKDMLRQKKKDMPERPAFCYPVGKGRVETRTFGDFAREVSALGSWLFLRHFHGAHIGIAGDNSYEWLLAFCAIACSGNVAVPMDKELPARELSALLHKADVEAVFLSRAVKMRADALCTPKAGPGEGEDVFSGFAVFDLDDVGEYIAQGQRAKEEVRRAYADFMPDTDAPCCMMFTSGTSGESKGVVLSHGNLAADIYASSQLVVLHGGTVALLPFHHAFGLVVGVFMVFHYGFSVYINRSMRTIAQSMQTAEPQNLFLVPLFIETFHRQIWAAAKKEGRDRVLKRLMGLSNFLLCLGIDVRRRCFASVREAFGGKLEYMICGGAALDAAYVREFRSWGIEILNGYGTTECSPCAAVNRNHYHRDGTVGLAVPGSCIKIAEDGEVLIKGAHVMLGYYGQEQADAQVLHDGWYATGDLGRLDSDGFLTLTGRKKNLIILSNGENVSPEELERDLLRDDAVREVLVYAQDGVITAEIYPDEEYWSGLSADVSEPEKEAYYQALVKRTNHGRPAYKQVKKVRLRAVEFEKNTSRKIIRR